MCLVISTLNELRIGTTFIKHHNIKPLIQISRNILKINNIHAIKYLSRGALAYRGYSTLLQTGADDSKNSITTDPNQTCTHNKCDIETNIISENISSPDNSFEQTDSNKIEPNDSEAPNEIDFSKFVRSSPWPYSAYKTNANKYQKSDLNLYRAKLDRGYTQHESLDISDVFSNEDEIAYDSYHKDEPQLNTYTRVKIYNVPYHFKWQQVKDFVKPCGDIRRVYTSVEDLDHPSHTYYVDFLNHISALNAVTHLNHEIIHGNEIEVVPWIVDLSISTDGSYPIYVGTTIRISNLPITANFALLFNRFREAGKILSIEIHSRVEKERIGNEYIKKRKHSGIGMIIFSTSSEARNAINKFNLSTFLGNVIYVREDRYEVQNLLGKSSDIKNYMRNG